MALSPRNNLCAMLPFPIPDSATFAIFFRIELPMHKNWRHFWHQLAWGSLDT